MADDLINNIPVPLWQEQRCVVHFFYQCNMKAAECYKMLKEIYSKETIGNQTVYDWYARFNKGRTTAVPKPSSGKPVSASTVIMKNTLAALIAEDTSLSQCKMAPLLDISKTTVQRILKKDLKLMHIFSKWMSHFLTHEQLDECVTKLSQDEIESKTAW